MEFDKIVKKLFKGASSIIDVDALCALAAPGVPAETPRARAAAHKLAYRLKSAGIIAPVKSGLWTVVRPGPSASPDPDALYWKLLRKACVGTCGRDWMVAGTKALELHLRDVSAPAEIRVLTAGPSGVRVLLPGHRVRFAPLRAYASAGKSLFSKLRPFCVPTAAEGVALPVACVELALLEYLTGAARGSDGHLVAKALAKFGPSLRRDALGALVSLRYIVAANRLKDAAKRLGFADVYAACLDVVKREGRGRFLSA